MDLETQHDELAACLRSWRDRLTPAEVGLPVGSQRRAPGLRREEVAALAGLSVDYLARLEQGRASSPSASVLGALARALRVTDAERAHLFRAAGLAEPGSGRMNRHLTPGVQRVLDRLADVPVRVIDPSYTVVAENALATALLGPAYRGRGDGEFGDNTAVWLFSDTPGRVVHSAKAREAFETEVVSSLHESLARYPEDPDLRRVVDYLLGASARFAELWEQRPVKQPTPGHKTIEHPEVGPITVDCDVLTVQASDLRLVVYTAAPGSTDADALALLGTIGLQTF